jgi:hypothetical protein
MRKIIFLTIISLISIKTLSQDLIYSRNAWGTIDIYRSSQGIPQGQPIGNISKSPLGYIEVKEFTEDKTISQKINPYNERPTLFPVKPFMAPTVQILNTFNSYLNLIKNQKQAIQQGKPVEKGNNLKQLFVEMQARFTDIKSFYDQVLNKPVKVNNGWHNVTLVSSNPIKGITGGEKMIKVGYAYVSNNRPERLIVNDYTGFYMFETNPILSGTIDKCKAFYKLKGSSVSYNNEMYFLDYLLDTTTRATLPKIGTVKFYPSETTNEVGLGIFTKDPNIYGETGEHFVGLVYMARDKEGKLSETNYFSSYTGNYFYKAYSSAARSEVGSFSLSEGSELSISLKL